MHVRNMRMSITVVVIYNRVRCEEGSTISNNAHSKSLIKNSERGESIIKEQPPRRHRQHEFSTQGTRKRVKAHPLSKL